MFPYVADLGPYAAAVGEFIQEAEGWLTTIAFILAFVKSLPFIPLLIPGTALLIGIGFSIGASGVDITPVWIAISAGAALGDWVSYWLGRRFAHVVHDSLLARRYPDLLPRGEAFFQRWGALSIVLCRFFGPLRATVPFVSGVCGLRVVPFQVANWFSAFLWSATLLSPGILAMKRL
ncbi:DedA family protein [Hoeflea sp. 108]|uniref:DedA family protein n=1 Tax=Hoeflea sp. 108 TaxID=1116369 RepID=UPI00036D6E57|nr:DedA family protein [Hoeflea sp. 108]